MSLLILAAGVFAAANTWFVWQVIHAPVIESAREYRSREDREVELLDAAWNLPVFSEGIHR